MSPALAVIATFWCMVPVLAPPFFLIWAALGVNRFHGKSYWLYLALSLPAFVFFIAVLFTVISIPMYMVDTG